MEQQALGLIETMGMTGAIEAMDICLKSANVQLMGYELASGGLVTVKIQGSVGAVKSSIDAAKTSASRISQVVATSIIPRPASGISCMISSGTGTEAAADNGQVSSTFPLNEEHEDDNKEDKEALHYMINTEEAEDEKELEAAEEKNELEEKPALHDNKDEDHSKKKQDEAMTDGDTEEEKENSCNLCEDPLCHRKKGQPRSWCIHYQGKG